MFTSLGLGTTTPLFLNGGDYRLSHNSEPFEGHLGVGRDVIFTRGRKGAMES